MAAEDFDLAKRLKAKITELSTPPEPEETEEEKHKKRVRAHCVQNVTSQPSLLTPEKERAARLNLPHLLTSFLLVVPSTHVDRSCSARDRGCARQKPRRRHTQVLRSSG